MIKYTTIRKDDVMMRVDREVLAQLRTLTKRHPLKPTLRATVERAIELMIEDLEEELKNVSK
jgi:hypothetical protein